jgi:DnaJ-class molecular chaperone
VRAYQDPTDDGSWEPVRCPVCAGAGYVSGDPEGAPIEHCDECGGSGEIDPGRSDKLARERASCVSISSYLDDR